MLHRQPNIRRHPPDSHNFNDMGIEAKKEKTAMTKSVKKLSEQLKEYTAELEDLKKQIKILDRRPLGKSFTVNRRTGVTHRILTTYDDMGMDARTICKWPYLQAGGLLTADPPSTRQATCDTCLPALKASLS